MALTRLHFFALAAAVLIAGQAAAAPPDPFAVPGVHVDATGASATAARDAALAQGRPIAWSKLYRKLAPQSAWGKQPVLNDFQLQHIIRSFEIANERRSNTRYIADITYVFSQAEVRKILRATGAPLAEAGAKPALVVPLVGGRFDAASPWTKAWLDPTVGALMPLVFPRGDAQDNAFIAKGNFNGLNWDAVAALAQRYGAVEVVIAEAAANGQSARLTELFAPRGRVVDSIAVAQPNFTMTAMAAARKLAESWRERSAIDYGSKSRLLADVEFSSLAEWARIRARLTQVKLVASYEVNGIALNEARVRIAYYGRAEQLAAAMSQQQLDFISEGGSYRLRYRAGPAPGQQEEPVVPPVNE
jgi:Uncharacterized protein conserved in bacteria (DUF2066)